MATITILPAVRKKCLTSAASLSVLVHKAHEMSFAPHRSYAQSVRLYVDARMCPFTKSTTGRATVSAALIFIQGVALSEARRSRKSMTSLCFSSRTPEGSRVALRFFSCSGDRNGLPEERRPSVHDCDHQPRYPTSHPTQQFALAQTVHHMKRWLTEHCTKMLLGKQVHLLWHSASESCSTHQASWLLACVTVSQAFLLDGF